MYFAHCTKILNYNGYADDLQEYKIGVACLYTIIGDKKRLARSRYDLEQSDLALICRGYLQDLASDLVKRIAEI